jgi:hypothetical protein
MNLKMKKILFFALIFAFFAHVANAKTSHISQKIMLGDSVKLKEYAGTYKLSEGAPIESLKFSVVGDELKVEAEGYPATTVNNVEPDTFEEPNYKALFVFTRTNGIVTGFKQSVRGMEMIGTKVMEKK